MTECATGSEQELEHNLCSVSQWLGYSRITLSRGLSVGGQLGVSEEVRRGEDSHPESVFSTIGHWGAGE